MFYPLRSGFKIGDPDSMSKEKENLMTKTQNRDKTRNRISGMREFKVVPLLFTGGRAS